MREIGLQYSNCVDNVLARDIATRLGIERRTAVIRHFSKNQECTALLNESKTYIEQINKPVVSVSLQRWINDSCCANIAMNKCFLCKEKTMNHLEKNICLATSNKFSGVCKDIDVFTNIFTIEQCDRHIFELHDKNYVTMKMQEESKSRR